MKWLLKRMLIVCLTMGVLCAAVVVVGRLDHSPSKLQVLGISDCDGEVCFKGLGPGTDWSTVKQQYPKGYSNEENYRVEILRSEDSKTVLSVLLTGTLPFSMGDVIAQFGAPCLVEWADTYNSPTNINLSYPTMSFSFIVSDNANSSDLRATFDTPDHYFGMSTLTEGNNCNPVVDNYGPWRGFASAEAYRNFNAQNVRRFANR